MKLRPDDLEVGKSVIVESALHGLSSFSQPSSDDFNAYADMQWIRTYGGIPAEIVAISLPYVGLRVFAKSSDHMFGYSPYSRDSSCGSVHSIDCRRFVLISCSQEMALAFISETLPTPTVDLCEALGQRVATVLEREGIRSLDQLVMYYRHDMVDRMSGLGTTSLRKIDSLMSMLGIKRG